MRYLIKPTLLLLLVTTATTLRAQQFGGNPPQIKWRQVNTPAARVIFPAGMDSAGIRIANIISQMNSRIQATIGGKQKQISIVLQNQTTQSNGYVGLAPFRSEFYLTPDQNNFELGSLRWTDQLAVHEFRHVQQFNNFDVGLSHALRVIFGEGGQAVGNELSIPNWFFEGDAVFNETYVTTQGRGRLPYFFNGYRALWAAGKNYSYMKLRNGSYRDYVPDHYPLGYMLVSYGREKYGDDFWKNVTHDAASLTKFYPMQSAIKKYSWKSFGEFRDSAFYHYKTEFNSDGHNGPHIQKFAFLNKKDNRHFIADQEYPAYVDDNTIIYNKSTYNHPPVFVINKDGVERTITGRNFSLDSYFDYHDGKIVYASYRPDLRWSYRDYEEITLVDVQTGQETRITKGTKYFSPSISADGKRIVAVRVTPDGKNELHILDMSGKVLTVIANSQNLFYTYPKFYGDKIIAAVRKADGTMSIAMIDPANGNTEYLLAFSIKPIAFPSVHQDKVYFSATEGKNDGLFALSLTDKKLYRLQNDTTKTNIGNYQPTVSAGKIAWVSFTAYGYQLHQANSSAMQWQAIEGNAIPGTLPDMGITALSKGNASDLLASVQNTTAPVSKYNKAFHLVNFHTLQPNFVDPNYTIALQGENVLNTLQTQLSFNYNSNEGYKEYGLGTVYGALFPYLSAGVDYIVDRKINTTTGNIYYDQLQYYAGIEIPLTLSKGRTSTGLAFGSNLVYSRNFFSGLYNNSRNNRELWYLDNYVSFGTHGRSARKNIYPSLGLNLSADYKTAINGIDANQFLGTGNVYLPGLFTNHSLVITGAYHQRDKYDNGGFSNDFPFARGYSAENLYQISKVSADYHFPIAYPDAGVANAAYLSRIRANIFYDYSYGYDPYVFSRKIDDTFRTAGAQITFDGQLWNFLPYSIAIRYSHLLDDNIFSSSNQHNRIEIVIPISLF
ncbi:hypothetical protein BDD43_2711 [Mucilaginibacter gracilis]|uniref:WD40 repeat protein n=1 Tax=Mucilaginibacter gracilis TaxID=423350 RepID=A0A495J0L2_9SPHI|nr:hypothetical protein [Mucilaginibacter gracilis]RKR82526.1 hypothetical protein BDD43_2711 [Mucilaginibacter gracilis]